MGSVMIIYFVHGVGHSPVSQILLHMIVKAEIMASPPFFINSAGMLSSPGDFPLSDISLPPPLPLLGWGICHHWCRRDHLVWLCHHCSHDCIGPRFRAVFCEACYHLMFFCETILCFVLYDTDTSLFGVSRFFDYALLVLLFFRSFSMHYFFIHFS